MKFCKISALEQQNGALFAFFSSFLYFSLSFWALLYPYFRCPKSQVLSKRYKRLRNCNRHFSSMFRNFRPIFHGIKKSSILRHKGVKRIFSTNRHERVHKNDFEHEWPKSSTLRHTYMIRTFCFISFHKIELDTFQSPD